MSSPASIKHFLESPARSVNNVQYRLRETWRRYTSRVNPEPVLVFGNQKAGTSAIAALLGEATGLSYTIDIFCFYQGLEEQLLRSEVPFDALVKKARYSFSKDIVKDPSFVFFYDELAARFPQAKRVFVLRDPRQNIRSILNRLALPGHLNDLSPEHWARLQREFPGWCPILDGRFTGHSQMTYIEALALRCQQVFQIHAEHQSSVVPIYYEHFNEDKVTAIHQLVAQLGLPFVHSIDQVKDIQFQPRGNAAIALEDFFGAKNLDRIEEICGDTMRAVGYSL